MEIEYQTKTPGQLADILLELTARYSSLMDELDTLLQLKDTNWSILRDTVSSDKQADQRWFQTSTGKRERTIMLELKKIKQIQSNIKTVLSVRENEARNLY